MKTATEFEMKVSDKEIAEDNTFVLMEVSKVTLKDLFMRHRPRTKNEKKLKSLIEEAIHNDVKEFYCPRYAPSFNEDGGICYEPGGMPAVGKSYNYWKQLAKDFNPERLSRLGDKFEYALFLGILIKKLIDSGVPVKKAWHMVCNDSKDLGHYWDSENAKHEFEHTGSREVLGFCDLANTYKILEEDRELEGFWLAGGHYFSDGSYHPLAGLILTSAFNRDSEGRLSVGWIVFEK